MFTLYVRHQGGDLTDGMPLEFKSNFNSLEEALAQAVHDLTPGEGGSGRVSTTGYSPVRIEDENGNIVRDRGDLEKATAAA